MTLYLLFAVGAAIIAVTAWQTASRYGELPDRVPLHFGVDGTVNNYGPRPAVWTMVAAQVFCGVGFIWVASGLVPNRAAMASFGDIMLLILWRAQALIIETAISGKTRADLRGFWVFFALSILAAVAILSFGQR